MEDRTTDADDTLPFRNRSPIKRGQRAIIFWITILALLIVLVAEVSHIVRIKQLEDVCIPSQWVGIAPRLEGFLNENFETSGPTWSKWILGARPTTIECRIGRTAATGELGTFLRKFGNIETLAISKEVDSAFFENLTPSPSVTFLYWYGGSQIPEEGLALLRAFPNLAGLEIRVAGADFEQFPILESLDYVNLHRNSDLNHEGVLRLLSLPSLTNLRGLPRDLDKQTLEAIESWEAKKPTRGHNNQDDTKKGS